MVFFPLMGRVYSKQNCKGGKHKRGLRKALCREAPSLIEHEVTFSGAACPALPTQEAGVPWRRRSSLHLSRLGRVGSTAGELSPREQSFTRIPTSEQTGSILRRTKRLAEAKAKSRLHF